MADFREVLHNHNELRERAVECIHNLAEVAAERNATFTLNNVPTSRAHYLRDSASRLEKNEFTLAVVGEFSRGKSSLINALLETHDLLPTAVKPSTAAITVLKYGEEPQARVHFSSGNVLENVSLDQLSRYVVADGLDGTPLKTRLTERVERLQAQNKVEDLSYEEIGKEVQEHIRSTGEADTVAEVVVTYPSPFLEDGIVLVDTPGIGSVNPRHGEATRRFIHRADAVIFLINTDPVISASECNFLTFLKDYVNRFLFVVTKIDRFTSEERTESLEYTRSIIVENAGIPDPPIFPVSAKLAMEGQREHSSTKMLSSGFPAFVRALDVFLIRERGQSFVREHVTEALHHLHDVRNSVQMELNSINLSIEELRQKLDITRPELHRAREAKDRIMAYLTDQERDIREVVMGSGNIDWMRISFTLREEAYRRIDEYDWDALKQASELVPILVRDFMEKELSDKLDEITLRMSEVRARVLSDCNTILDEMNQRIGTQFEGLRIPANLDVQFAYDPGALLADLKKVTTITIGSTLALTIGGVFLFGPAGAAVMLGGVLAGTGLHSLFRNRVKKELKEQLREPLNDVVDTILNNINHEVASNLANFRGRMDETLSSAISSVEETLASLEEQVSSAEFSSAERRDTLARQKSRLDEVEAELSLIVGPGW